MTIQDDYDIRPLAAAVCIQAAIDARSGEPHERRQARAWLASDGLFWLSVCGVDLDPEQMRRWQARGCPMPKRRGRARLAFAP